MCAVDSRSMLGILPQMTVHGLDASWVHAPRIAGEGNEAATSLLLCG